MKVAMVPIELMALRLLVRALREKGFTSQQVTQALEDASMENARATLDASLENSP